MSSTYRFEGRIFHAIFEGSTTDEEIRELYDRASSDPALPKNCLSLIDVRKSTSLAKRSSDSIRGIAEFVSRYKYQLGSKLAALVEAPVQQGVMNMGSVFSERFGIEMGIFRCPDEARAWLLEQSEEERQTIG